MPTWGAPRTARLKRKVSSDDPPPTSWLPMSRKNPFWVKRLTPSAHEHAPVSAAGPDPETENVHVLFAGVHCAVVGGAPPGGAPHAVAHAPPVSMLPVMQVA